MMNKSNTLITLIVMALLSLCSCANYKNVPYFQNADQFDGSAGASLYDMTIKPKDRLLIVVFSSTDGKAVAPFNMREPREPEYQDGRMVARARQGRHLHGYLVDNDGNIDYPVLGTVHVAGLTIDSINSHIRHLISPYLQPGADCLVKTLIENYEITVIGEVNKPNTFTLSRPEVNVLEALAMAGDMTIYGKRDN